MVNNLTKPVIDVEQRQLMLQAVLALAQRVDPAADRGHALAQVQIKPLYKTNGVSLLHTRQLC